mmetsp:Transcript_21313/g.48985  ORF Transcript_21313/g.48985 Transcript_21313/m.48985 type:complete len:368 (-) Transcript_21313:323-1426(-)
MVDGDALRQRFRDAVVESSSLPPANRLIMYDACDAHEVSEPLGGRYRKRLDARRGNKPKKSDDQRDVCTPFNPAAFNFTKISNQREILARLPEYNVLTNRFPLFPGHMLLTAKALVPQQLSATHLSAIAPLVSHCGFSAYFNSWCASASVNHFHCHLIDELPPVAQLRLVTGPHVLGEPTLRPAEYSGSCYVFGASQLGLVGRVVAAMQAENQPHNLLFTPLHIYVWPKPLQRPARSFELYPETVGGPELLGSFTVYTEGDYAALSAAAAEELVRINTAPLPKRLLSGGDVLSSEESDDASDEGMPPLKQQRTFGRKAAVRTCQSLDSVSLVNFLRSGSGLEAFSGPLPLAMSKSQMNLSGPLEVGS